MLPVFVAFIERQVKILSDPLFGDLQGMPSDPSKPKSRYTGRGQATVAAIKTLSGSTTSAAWHQQRRGPASQKNDKESCCVCKSQRSVEKCSQLDDMTHREKLDALKVGRVCFSCLRRGHMSRECDKPLTCDIFKHKHPTVLHIESKTQEVSVNNALASLETCGHTGTGSDECVLSIVPVQVKAKSGSTIVNTYALLDPGSSASFCTQHLTRKLNLSGVKTSILLRSLGQEGSVDTFLLSGLEVSGLNEENFLDLPFKAEDVVFAKQPQHHRAVSLKSSQEVQDEQRLSSRVHSIPLRSHWKGLSWAYTISEIKASWQQGVVYSPSRGIPPEKENS